MGQTIDVTALEALAVSALRDVAADSTATFAARAQAARTLLEYTQAIGSAARGREKDSNDPLAMSAEKLDRMAKNPDKAGSMFD